MRSHPNRKRAQADTHMHYVSVAPVSIFWFNSYRINGSTFALVSSAFDAWIDDNQSEPTLSLFIIHFKYSAVCADSSAKTVEMDPQQSRSRVLLQ